MTIPLDRHHVVELPASEERVPRIRRVVSAHLRQWRLDLHVAPVCRGIEEVLTHVRLHVGEGDRCVLELRWAGRHLTVSVEDNGPRMPRLLTADGGLGRLAALSDSWGTCATADGKVIWFTRSVFAPQDVPRVSKTPLTGLDAAQRGPAPTPAPVPALVPPVPTEPPTRAVPRRVPALFTPAPVCDRPFAGTCDVPRDRG
ncbi:ATP-binding protein [Streptomyces sp. NRRL F-5135]|uniref:ATP-binding protein n=1 Tax=Streptomyces sp. NRRL F-5135 TaxID=1463858 RepID=UPI000AA377E3|nr:ATP-binding protein [Streptomyces sp. NRRL F-5135]